MHTQESAILKRTCEGIQIPSGSKITLFEGTHLTIMQALGGSYTVMTDQGMMASIMGKDADALGKSVTAASSVTDEAGQERPVEEQVWAQLRTCFDPEIPHNIVDLGLIYDCKVESPEEGHRVEIKMTLTAPGCGMGEYLKRDIEGKILAIPGVKHARVDVVFDPPWNPSRMNPALRRALNMM